MDQRIGFMGRKLTFLAYVLVVFIAGKSFALGLGEIELDSALNQNFSATIPVTGASGLADYEVLVSLASKEDFKRVGVERFFYLTNIRFNLVVGNDGSLVISLDTPQPVSEPYLNFLVEVRWPNGRLLKEFTVLLDPPTFSKKQAPVVAAPSRSDPSGGGRSQASRTTTPKTVNNKTSAPSQTNQRSTPSQTRSTSNEVSKERFEQLTNRDDTLWQIASDARPTDAVSIQQTMLAVQRLNPRAFIRGNINLLKAGYRLELPTESDINELTGREANQKVAQHNKQWNAYRSGNPSQDLSSEIERPSSSSAVPDLSAQVDATTQTTETVADSQSPEGQLRIISGSGESSGSSSAGDSNDDLNRSLSESAEEIERISRENDELQYRLDRVLELESQAIQQSEAKSQQIELQDKRLAELQAQLDLAKTELGQSGSETGEASLMETLTSPLVLILGFLVLLLTGGLIFVSSRARREVNEAYDLIPDEGFDDTEQSVNIEPLVFGEDDQDDDVGNEELDDDETDNLTDSQDIEGAQTSDVIGEADIYIAYGRYPQALALLNTAVESDPSRSDVRLKLLEIYAETEDQAMFDSHMQVLIETCDDEDTLLQAREISAQFNSQDQILDIDDSLLNSESVDTDEIPESEEFENSLEDDFDLELDEEDIEEEILDEAIEPTAVNDTEKLGGDLGMDFDPEDQLTEIREPDSEEFDLDDLELDDSDTGSGFIVDENESETESSSDDAFEFLDEEDASSTKLDLARAYIDMGDEDGAREILAEVISEGSDDQQSQANELLAQLK